MRRNFFISLLLAGITLALPTASSAITGQGDFPRATPSRAGISTSHIAKRVEGLNR
jgi:hypothetical protein